MQHIGSLRYGDEARSVLSGDSSLAWMQRYSGRPALKQYGVLRDHL